MDCIYNRMVYDKKRNDFLWNILHMNIKQSKLIIMKHLHYLLTLLFSFIAVSGLSQTDVKSYTVNGVSFQMVYVEGGTFWMGALPKDKEAYDIEKPRHQVSLSSFSIGMYEVTQELWQAVMGSNPSHFKGDLKCPVEQVSWYECQEFINKLNSQIGENFRLPTEAEWEYAARGGQKSRGYLYSGNNKINRVAWYDDNSNDTTHPVGQKHPNELGIYDMTGNVWEWCSDWYDSYRSTYLLNPSYRVIRGGGFHSDARNSRASYRYGNTPQNKNRKYREQPDQRIDLGLRLAL